MRAHIAIHRFVKSEPLVISTTCTVRYKYKILLFLVQKYSHYVQ